ncbi:MAG TPA: LysR family transcriptional regulator [Parachlamydiaceae bacterium]|nr:LysR family transcriptional regulator [Parachlamydiaceae bacterium]
MPNLSQMETFVLTSELGSLAAAGRKLGISAAAISKQLTRLEEELGLQLLVRSTRRIELTEVGKNYCLQCRRVLEEVEVASALVSQVKSVPQGPLKVVSARYFASAYIVPHMKEFLLKYPEIELNLELAERIPDLNAEGIDVLIGMSISATGDAIQKRIGTTRYLLSASPAYLKKFGVPKKPEDLKKHQYITHSMRQPENELVFDDKEIVTVMPFIKVNDVQTMIDFALDGLGIIKLHHYAVKEQLKHGTLQEVLPAHNQLQIPLYVAYPQRRYISSKVRCFIDFIIEKYDYTVFIPS